MANQKHARIINLGVEVWNEWRQENSEITPDLRGVDLSWGKLNGVNFTRADLRNADFFFAELIEADFSGANLREANLSDANLRCANLRRANLSNAYLSVVDLGEANLTGANLTGVDLGDSLLYETIFVNTNLTGVENLEGCQHFGPSTVDHRTIIKSCNLPRSFLAGCGLPNGLINYYSSLINEAPQQFYSCFISYSEKDREFAERLYSDLRDNGVLCFFSPHDIQGGKKIHEQIEHVMKTYDRLLLILSEHSMNSEWVKTEIANARQKEIAENIRVLFPIRLIEYKKIKTWKCFDADTGKDSAREIREYFIPDFSDWEDGESYEKAFERLLRDLRADDRVLPK